MERAKRIISKGIVERHSDALGRIEEPGDTALVVRGVTRSMTIKCPDGCGEVISVNLDDRAGPAWRLYTREGKTTLYPSVWRETGCKAHFIVWRDRIIWCDRHDATGWMDVPLKQKVAKILPPPGEDHAHFEQLASHLDMIPWEVLWACHSLERDGIAVSSKRGTLFGLAK